MMESKTFQHPTAHPACRESFPPKFYRWLFLIFYFDSTALFSQTNSDSTNVLTLLPPYAELPLTFWEQHQTVSGNSA